MEPEQAGQVNLDNDTVINVAALLREQMGATRSYRFWIDRFSLDEDLEANEVAGLVRLTRLSDAILVTVNGRTQVKLECQRCLETFEESIKVDFSDEFRIAYDVKRGTMVKSEVEGPDERLEISENHELDFSEPMRQEIIIALPMIPVCGENCPGPPAFEDDESDAPSGQFATLASLLGSSDEKQDRS